MPALDHLAINDDLAAIHRVRDDVLEVVASEDDGGWPVVLGLAGTALGPHPATVQQLRECT
jgi:hypothetical protein